MATISASPNPVGIYGKNPPEASTLVNWNTNGGNGLVYVAKDGGGKTLLPGQQAGGAASGTLPLTVTLGSSYRLSLETQASVGSPGGEVAVAMVSTFDLRQQMAAGFSQYPIGDLRPQVITDLVVSPGVDTVVISFRTSQGTIPTTELRNSSGAWVDGKLPLFGGLRRRHFVEFGFQDPLALNEKHSFRIEAFGRPGTPKAVVTGEFITGRRNVDVLFDELDVRNDSDSGGAGEMSFTFGVGDVASQVRLGPIESWSGDVVDRDPPVNLGKSIALTDAPRLLWLQVNGQENDDDFPDGLSARGSQPEFEQPGGHYLQDGEGEYVSLTIHSDVDTDPGAFVIPFELTTGEWNFAFKVTGTIEIEAIAGSVIGTKMAKAKRRPSRADFLTEVGEIVALTADGKSAEAVGLGADGAVYHRTSARDRPGLRAADQWRRIELSGRGAPAVATSGPGKLDLVDLDARGGVLHCRVDGAMKKPPKWKKLGGNFVTVLPLPGGADGAKSSLSIFGVAADGGLHLCDADGGGDWQRLDGVTVRAAAPVPGAKSALLVVTADDRLVHVMERNGKWSPRVVEAKGLGKDWARALSASILDRVDGANPRARRQDLLIGALDAEHQVRALFWPDYPKGEPERTWRELGPLQALFETAARSPSRRRGSKASELGPQAA